MTTIGNGTFLPSGTASVLVEFDTLEQVLGLYTALSKTPPTGVIDLVPAAHTLFIAIDPDTTTVKETEEAIANVARQTGALPGAPAFERTADTTVEIAVTYDGEDLADAAGSMGCDVATLIERHTSEEWTAAFCGFAPGFAYLVGTHYQWHIPRRESPRVQVPPGAVAVAGEYASVYPRQSPGGWQLIGTTEHVIFDEHCDPPALLTPGTHVRFFAA